MNIGCVIDKPGNSKEAKLKGWRNSRPVWDQGTCNQCMICWWQCPDIAIPQKAGKRTETDLDYCKGCAICAVACPVKAISMVPEDKNG